MYFLQFSFYGKYDIFVNCGKSRKYDIYVERFYENVVFHAVVDQPCIVLMDLFKYFIPTLEMQNF